MRCLYVALPLALGAVGGASLRLFVSELIVRRVGASFPYATLIINVFGSLVLGGFAAFVAVRTGTSHSVRLMIATGFCGSFTTFSTFSTETVVLLETSRYAAAISYVAASVVLGPLAALLGAFVVRRLLL